MILRNSLGTTILKFYSIELMQTLSLISVQENSHGEPINTMSKRTGSGAGLPEFNT